MNRYRSINIILIFLIISGLLSLVIPSGVLNGENFESVTKPNDIVTQIFNAPINGFIGIDNGDTISYSNSGTMSGVVLIALLVMSIFMFTSVTFKSKIIDDFLFTHFEVISKYKFIFIFLIISFFSFCAFTHGMYETTIPIAIALFFIFEKLGYDKLYVTKIVLYSTSIGYIGSTINPFATGLAANLAGVSLSEQFILRMTMFIILFIFTVIHLLYISKKHLVEVSEEELVGSKSSVIDLLLFIVPFFVLSYSFLPFDIPFKLSFTGCIIMFILFSVVIGLKKFRNFSITLDYMFKSVFDVLPVIFVLSVSRGIYVILVNMKVDDSIIYYLVNTISEFNYVFLIIAISIFFMILSIFISSSSAIAYLTIPLLTPVFNATALGSATLVTIYQTSIGIVHIFSITSVVVISLIVSSNVTYKDFIKSSYVYILCVMLICYSTIFIFL